MFHNPLYLLGLLLVPLLVWRMIAGRGRASVPFSSDVTSWTPRPTWRQRIAWLPAACTIIALILMILAMARPREGRERAVIDAEGIAIELLVDRSSSMRALDFKIDGQSVDRLAAVKNVAGRFISGDSQPDGDGDAKLSGRASDLVGLITFAGFADAITPPTLDHNFLVARLNAAEIVNESREDGTAIGDGISLAVEKLDSLDQQKTEKVKSKVIILLTDGKNTAGEVDPMQAAEMAAAMGIKVYTIGVGTKGVAMVPTPDPFSRRIILQPTRVDIDEQMLTEIAEMTRGKYFRATDTASLEAIYGEIDQMEKTKVQSQSFVDYRELAVQSVRLFGYRVPPLLLLALVALAIRVLLSHTVLRHFP